MGVSTRRATPDLVIIIDILSTKHFDISISILVINDTISLIVYKLFVRLTHCHLQRQRWLPCRLPLYAYSSCNTQSLTINISLIDGLGIYALKEIILKYRSMNSSTFLCFLDASKAFDHINHVKLFEKLIK